MSRDNLSRARVLNTDTATLQLSTVQRMVAKILDKRDSLLHKSLNAVTEAARGRGQPCCNFGSRDAQRESPSFCSLSFTFPPRVPPCTLSRGRGGMPRESRQPISEATVEILRDKGAGFIARASSEDTLSQRPD